MKTNQSPAPQAPARKRRNTYRNLAIELYARNSSSMPRISRGMHFVVDGIYQPPKMLYLCTRFKNYENGRTNDY